MTEDSLSIDVFVDLSMILVYVPNVLNTSSSINNNELTIELPPDILEVTEFSIYDRWGQQVAFTERIQQGEIVIVWDGTFRNQSVTPGVYVYTYDMLTVYGPERRRITGDITIIN